MNGEPKEKEWLDQLEVAQRSEITEYRIYSRLASVIPNKQNSEVLQRIAEDERRHHDFWMKYTHRSVAPKRWKVFLFYWISRLFGITFGIKLI